MIFSNIIGNEQAKETLINLGKQVRDSHILLFSGIEGVGKKTFVLAFLHLLLGEKHTSKIESRIHPDVIWIKPEGKLHLHTVANIKQIIDEAPLSPFEAKKKVYVIEEADRMQPASSNALLKILEEPPSHVSFLLLTAKEEGILPTILSRCSKIPFYPIEEALLISFLERKGATSEQASKLAKSAKGSLSIALKALVEEKDPIRLHFIEILRHFFLQPISLNFIQALDHLDKLIEEKEELSIQIIEKLMEDVLFWVRDLQYMKEDLEGKNLFFSQHLEDLRHQSLNKIPSLENTILALDKARLGFQRGIKPKAVMEKLFAELQTSIW